MNQKLIELPKTISEYCSDVELSADVMFVNKVPFLATVSELIHCTTVNALDNLKVTTLEKTLGNVFNRHRVRVSISQPHTWTFNSRPSETETCWAHQ